MYGSSNPAAYLDIRSKSGKNGVSIIDLLSSREPGEYYYTGEDDLHMSSFDTPEDFGYFNTIQWLEKRFSIIKTINENNKNNKKKINDIGSHLEFTIGVRERSIVLSHGKNVTEKSYEKMGKELERDPNLIDRIQSPSLFQGIQSILYLLGSLIPTNNNNSQHYIQDNNQYFGLRSTQHIPNVNYKKKDKKMSSLKSLIENNQIKIYIVGGKRKVILAKSFIACTFQFLDENGKPYFPSSIESYPLDKKVIVPYDLNIALRHVIYVNQLLIEWKEVNKWSGFDEETKIIDQLIGYKSDPINIAITGKSNSGKSIFINGILCRNILPSCPDKSSSSPIEIKYASSLEKEYAQLEIINEIQFNKIIENLDEQLLSLAENIEIIENPSKFKDNESDLESSRESSDYHNNYDIITELTILEKMKIVSGNIKKLKEKLFLEYRDLQLKYPDGIMKCKVDSAGFVAKKYRDKKINTFMENASEYHSPIRSRLIVKGKIYIHHPLLQSVNLIELPGISEAESSGHHHYSEILENYNSQIQGWLYLIPMMNVSGLVFDDIEILKEYCQNGIVVMTKFDEALCELSEFPIQKIVEEKINILSNYIHQKNFPSVSMRILYYMTQFNKKNEKIIESMIDSLVKSHVGSYISIPDEFQIDNDHSYDDDYYMDDDNEFLSSNDVNEMEKDEKLPFIVGYTCFLRSNCNSRNIYHRALRDSSKEASLLMALLAQIYDKIDSDFINEKYSILLCDLSIHLNSRLISISEKIHTTAVEIDTRTKKKQEQSIEITKSKLLDELTAEKSNIFTKRLKIKKDLDRLIYDKKEKLKSELNRKQLEENVNKRRHRIIPNIRIRSHTHHHQYKTISIISEFDRKFIKFIENEHKKIFSNDNINKLLHKFDYAKERVILLVDSISYGQNVFSSSLQNRNSRSFSTIDDDIEEHYKSIKSVQEDMFVKIFNCIEKEVQCHIDRLEGFERLNRQNNGAVAPLLPVSLLQTRLQMLKNEYGQLQKLYSSVMHVFLQHQIQERGSKEKGAERETAIRKLCTEMKISSSSSIVVKK